MDFTIHPDVYVIDDNCNKYTDVSQLNEDNELFQQGHYFYIVFTIKNDFMDFTYKINATFCTQKHKTQYTSHCGYDLAVQMNNIFNDKPLQVIEFPRNSKYNDISIIHVKNDYIYFNQSVASSSGHDTKMVLKLPYDDNMKWIIKSVAYFFTHIDFKDEE